MSNEHETLKPCPWCESAAVRVAYVRVSDDCRWHHVECANCLAYGPHRSTEAEAIAAWNIRATPSPSTDTLESVALTPRQLGAVIDALNFVLADDWDADSHDPSDPVVHERALAKLMSLKGRFVKVKALGGSND